MRGTKMRTNELYNKYFKQKKTGRSKQREKGNCKKIYISQEKQQGENNKRKREL